MEAWAPSARLPRLGASQAVGRALGGALPGGEDTVIALTEEDLAPVQRQTVSRVGGLGAKLLQRGLAGHQSRPGSP